MGDHQYDLPLDRPWSLTALLFNCSKDCTYPNNSIEKNCSYIFLLLLVINIALINVSTLFVFVISYSLYCVGQE